MTFPPAKRRRRRHHRRRHPAISTAAASDTTNTDTDTAASASASAPDHNHNCCALHPSYARQLPPFAVTFACDGERVYNAAPDAFQQWIKIRPAGQKGLGVFATACSDEIGRALGVFTGTIVQSNRDEMTPKETEYVFEIKRKHWVDARPQATTPSSSTSASSSSASASSTPTDDIHWSGRLNHSSSHNLSIRESGRIVQIKPFHVGDELTINYGRSYWKNRSPPCP
jgi:hypothetical protein